MRDLTQGPIAGHLLGMAAFIGVSLIFQTMYFIIDLYFVSRLGSAAIAGVKRWRYQPTPRPISTEVEIEFKLN